MKVFQLEKNNLYHKGQQIFNMDIEEAKKINRIIVSNPEKSNCLCVINHLVCTLTENKNIAHLIITNEEKELKDITTFGNLNISYDYDRAEDCDNLEIDIVNIDKNLEVDILEKHFLIILPGGNIQIKLEKPQEKMSLQISVGQETI